MRISDWSSDVCSSDLFSCQPVDENILPEKEVALFDREAALAAHVEVEPDLPRHPDAAVNLHAVACGGVIGFGGRTARGVGGRDAIVLPLARGVLAAVGAAPFHPPVQLADPGYYTMENALQIAEPLARHHAKRKRD